MWMFSSSALAFDSFDYVTNNSLSRGDMMDMLQADVWRDFNFWSCLAVFASHFRKNICCNIIYLLKPVEAHWSCIGPEVFSDLFQL